VWKDGASVEALRETQRRQVAQEAVPRTAPPLALPPEGRISLLKDGKLAAPFGAGWIASDDRVAGGASSVTLATRDSDGQAVVAVSASVKTGFFYPWAGVAFLPGAPAAAGAMGAADLSAARMIRFRVRGDGKTYQLTMASSGMRIPRSAAFTAGGEWQEVALPFSAFAGVDPAAVTMIGFNAGPQAGDYRFELADVRLADH